MSDNQLLMLCEKKNKIGLVGNFLSEKLDGQRLWWDSGVTAGLRVRDIPWAGRDPRKQDMLSTGLWSRLGNVVHAPDWWTKQLGSVMLDGECFMGYEYRQRLMSVIKAEDGSRDWTGVRFMCYDSMPAATMFSERTVTYGGKKQLISGAMGFARMASTTWSMGFKARLDWIKAHVIENDVVKIHAQHEVPFGNGAQAFLDTMLSSVLERGGEGLILKGRDARYECRRSYGCIKIKPFEDMEGVVVGFVSGKETDKGSRNLGRMGSLILRLANGRELQLSGFTDAERELSNDAAMWAANNPDTKSYEGTKRFAHGSVVSFKYRGLTADGIPSEARYWRKREDE